MALVDTNTETLRVVADKHRAELKVVRPRATEAEKREDLLLCDIRRERARPMVTDKEVLMGEQAKLIEALQLELGRNKRYRTFQGRELCLAP